MNAKRPMVSFVVPTLNRGEYVVRAVRSCLETDCNSAGVDIEVIVLDSQSDDGSWEALQREFGQDARVVLMQNTRGLGPTRSWLDGARLVRGDFVTFLWSDDYIAGHFLTALLPAIPAGTAMAVGRGAERPLDDNEPLAFSNARRAVPVESYLRGYYLRGWIDNLWRPFSPACSLFTRAAFDQWMALVEEWCTATPLRQQILWRRAIGPDLLLFLIAAACDGGDVHMVDCRTAQFSVHGQSITNSSHRVPFETGYWLALLWFLCTEKASARLPQKVFQRYAAAHFVYGLTLGMLSPGCGVAAATFKAYRHELALLVAAVAKRRAMAGFVLQTALALVTVPVRLVRTVLRGIRRRRHG